MMTEKNKQAVEACLQLFGARPEDVLIPIKSAADALSWLEEIFNTIKAEALNGSGVRIKQLAEAGAYIAMDIGNFAGCKHEEFIRTIRKNGGAE